LFLFIKKFVINNQTNVPKSIDFILNPYEEICKIMEIHKEQHLLYEIITYIINQTESNENGDNNILFFKNFDKVNTYNININIKKLFIIKNLDNKINP